MNKLDFLQKLSESFITKERPNGGTFRVIDDQKAGELKQKFLDLSMHCHDDMLPDDDRYRMIEICADVLLDAELDEDQALVDLSGQAPIYNGDLLQWAASSVYRIEYVDQALSDFEYNELIPALSMGYNMELTEVLHLMINWLDSNV